ncbi:YhgE/Pip domain-containing protein [Shimazuella kribbensis]|uniref:YhgE/Pip domain-containing protein n=1 Tax=Shimazuella kribbensis TaxID=139808 RepID=UPI000425A227|nr:YhgE/Pip domain-containing protein [Shimazuella kribbensis]
MKLFQVFLDDLKHFFKKPMLILTFLGVACVPILYSGFLLKGTWDPYGKLENLPVAVVNLDKGATYQDKTMNVGKEFIDELKKNPKFNWKFVDKNEAMQGMNHNRYYAMITIPNDFSADAASLNSDHPHQANIQYESNSYYNFIAGQISENATKEMKAKLSDNVTEAYTRSVFTQFSKLSKGLQTAGKGASDLNKGAVQLNEGQSKVTTNLAKLSSGAITMHEGTEKLNDGSRKLEKGTAELQKGALALAEGTQKLANAGQQLEAGAGQTATGTETLAKGIQTSKQGADKLTDGLTTSLKGSQQLEEGLSTSQKSSKELSNGAEQVANGLQQYQTAHPELKLDPNFQKLLAASQAVSTGSKQLSDAQSQLLAGSQSLTKGQEQLLSGSKQLSQGNSQLLQGANKLQAGQQQLSDGLHQYNTKFTGVVTGSQKLVQGASQIQNGASQLNAGIGELSSGTGSFVTGTKQLADGSSKLQSGSTKLSEGSKELATKLQDAANDTSKVKADDQTIQLFSTPVSIKENDDRHIDLYGYGIAPYFVSLALFAGALVFTTVYSARSSSTQKEAAGWKLFVSKTMTFALMSSGQSIIACTILVYLLGIEVQNVALFYAYTALVSFTFMFFCQAMVTWLDQIGRFIILLVMIFQLASSAGTFPFELLPDWAKALNPWLPMTYSIRGFRDVISSGNMGDLQVQANHLFLFLVAFLVITLGYFLFKRPKGRKPSNVVLQA